jgi:hypothetical protein
MAVCSKKATSSATAVVERVADEQVVGCEGAFGAVEGDHRLALRRPPHAEPVPAEGVEVVGVGRLVQLEHHVVADVDDVVDGSHAGGTEPPRHPGHRCSDLHARHHQGGEPRAALAVEHLDGGRARRPVGLHRGRSRSERHAEMCGNIAGKAEMPPTVGAVAGEVDVEHHLGGQVERLPVGNTHRGAGRQDEDARVVVAEAELASRAEHALRLDAEDRARFDEPAVGHGGTGRRQRDDVAGLHVERAAPDVPLDPVAGVDPHTVHLGGIGVALGAQHAGGDHAVDHRADGEHLLDLHTETGEHGGERRRVATEGCQVIEPGKNSLHVDRLRTAR